MTTSNLQQRVARWHATRFPGAGPFEILGKATEELGEVANEVNERCSADAGYDGDGSGMEGEAADLVIVLMALVGRFGNGDLLDFVEAKLAVLTDPESGHRAALARPYENPGWVRAVSRLGDQR